MRQRSNLDQPPKRVHRMELQLMRILCSKQRCCPTASFSLCKYLLLSHLGCFWDAHRFVQHHLRRMRGTANIGIESLRRKNTGGNAIGGKNQGDFYPCSLPEKRVGAGRDGCCSPPRELTSAFACCHPAATAMAAATPAILMGMSN